MKKILTAFFIIAVLTNFGCSDFLEETPYSQISEKEAYSTPTLVYINTVASLYLETGNIAFFGGDQGFAYGYYFRNQEFSADLGMIPGRQGDWVDGGAHQTNFFHSWTASFSDFLVMWNDIYKMIGLCNRAIERLQKLYDDGGGSYLTDYIYEIRGMRAYYYMLALNDFGRVPIVTSTSTAMSSVVQSSRSKVYEFVRNELIAIIPHLPAGKSPDPSTAYYGRITKDVGYMMMAKLAINSPVFASDTWNDGRFTGGVSAVESYITNAGKAIKITLDGTERNAWETVIYCQGKLAASGYTLSPDYTKLFLVGNDGNQELIWVRPNDKNTIKHWQSLPLMTTNYAHASAIGGFGANGPCATLECAYLFGGVKTGNQTYDFSNADPRWDKSFWWGYVYGKDGSHVASGISEAYNPYGEYLPFDALPDYNTTDFGDLKGKYIVKWGGARLKKVQFDPGSISWSKSDTEADIVVYRYADVLLLAAEAYYRNGDAGTALTLLNQVRARVGATPRASVNAQTILDERGLELAWESWRREDQIRFGTYTEATRDKYVGCPHANVAPAWSYDANGHTVVLPIPQDVLNLNSNLTQNPGY
jgi:starch-binding outer membrane protein, SusD/RagB family